MRDEDWLDSESASWAREGLVTEEQAAAIRQRYREQAAPRRRNRIVEVLAIVGAVVAGLGVVLFFAANWDGLPRPTRVLLLLVLVVGAHGGGFFLRDLRGTHPRVGEALLVLGGLAFGASLFLVGQMYHVQAHDPLAFLAMALGTGAIAWIARSQAVATLSLGAAGAWLAYEAAFTPGGDFDNVEFVPVAAALYGAALYGLGTGLGDRLGPFSAPARRLGSFLAPAGTFVFTFRWTLGEREPLETLVIVGLTLLAAGAVAGAAATLRSARPTAAYEAGALVAVAGLILLAIAVPESSVGRDPIVYPLLFNALLVVLALGAVVVGYLNDEPWLVTVGLVWVGIDLVARYIDFFWDMLPRSLVFVGVGGGILLLALVLERQRRGLLERMETR